MLWSHQPSFRTLDWVASLRTGRSLNGIFTNKRYYFRDSLMARYYFHIKAGSELIKDMMKVQNTQPLITRARKLSRQQESYGLTQSNRGNLWTLTPS